MADKKKPTCGIVMPISACDGMEAGHWAEVKAIFEAAIEDSGMAPRMVSDAPDASVIHTRIIRNVYEDELVLCDVSGRNPNVMFELGLRIAFDKPVVVVKDDATDYAFDIGPMEQVPYPRSLRYGKVQKFQEDLSAKLKATRDAGPDKSFLKSLGPFKIAAPDTEVVPEQQLLIDEIQKLRAIMEQSRRPTSTYRPSSASSSSDFTIQRIIFNPRTFSSDLATEFDLLAKSEDVSMRINNNNNYIELAGSAIKVERVSSYFRSLLDSNSNSA